MNISLDVISTDVFNFHRPGRIYTVYILMFTFITLLKSPMKCKWCYGNCYYIVIALFGCVDQA